MMSLGHELLAGASPAAAGVSFGGPVDYESGTVRLSHHVPGWENTRLQQILESEFSAPVRVDNDANVAALGEYRFGAGRGYDDLLYVTVSTGVGGGWILNGRPWRGYEAMAGEIGHTVVDPSGPVCLCGKRGCVERLASGPYMAQDFLAERGSRGAGERGSGGAGEQGSRGAEERGSGGAGEQRSGGGAVTGKTVAELAAQGDSVARRILERGAWALGVGIGNAANLINPRLFVLGGGVTKSGEQWWTTVRRAAGDTALAEVHFDVVAAALGDDAPLWGAVALAEACL
jgi:glucokinase